MGCADYTVIRTPEESEEVEDSVRLEVINKQLKFKSYSEVWFMYSE